MVRRLIGTALFVLFAISMSADAAYWGGQKGATSGAVTGGGGVLTISSVSPTTGTFAAGSGSANATVFTATATMSDASSFSGTWSITGTHFDKFKINPTTGVLTVCNTAPTCTALTTAGTFNINVVATQSGVTPFTQSVTITGTQTISGVSPTTGTFAAGSGSANAAVFTATATMSALPAFSGAWSLTGADAGKFKINSSTGALTVCNTAPTCTAIAASGPYNVNVVATQSGIAPFTQAVVITGTQVITGVAPATGTFPVGSGSANATVFTAIATMSASPAFSGTWSLTGTDAGKFKINASTGLLTVCNTAPTCTALTTTGPFNINLVATQSGIAPFTQAVVITGTQAITGVSPTTGTFAAGTGSANASVFTASATMSAPPAFSGSWSITGTDAGKFAINATTGLLTVCNTAPTCTAITTAGIFNINLVATQSGLSPFTQGAVITGTVGGGGTALAIDGGSKTLTADDGSTVLTVD